jgi:chemotaxis protein CheD
VYKKFDAKLKANIMTIFAGELYISTKQEVISTVLGSCISVCMYDSEKGIGGMNHFMLPESAAAEGRLYSGNELMKEQLTEDSMRYGITAMERLIGEMQKNGAHRINLRAKIFGGGKIITGKTSVTSVGDKNIGFARAYLKTEGIKIESENVGNTFGRKIFFLTGKNSVFVKKVALEPAILEERTYMKKLLELKQKTDVTIF